MSLCVSICIFCILESHKCFSWVPFRWLWEFLQSATLILVIFKVLSSISLSFLFSFSRTRYIVSNSFHKFLLWVSCTTHFLCLLLFQSCEQDARCTIHSISLSAIELIIIYFKQVISLIKQLTRIKIYINDFSIAAKRLGDKLFSFSKSSGLNFARSPIFEYTFGPKPNHHLKPGPRLLISSDILRYCWQGKQKFSSCFAQ